MSAKGRKHQNPTTALRQIQLTHPITWEIVYYKADGYKSDLGQEADFGELGVSLGKSLLMGSACIFLIFRSFRDGLDKTF